MAPLLLLIGVGLLLLAGYFFFQRLSRPPWTAANRETIRGRLPGSLSTSSQDCFLTNISNERSTETYLPYSTVLDYFDVGTADSKVSLAISTLLSSCRMNSDYLPSSEKKKRYDQLVDSLLGGNIKGRPCGEVLANCILNKVGFDYSQITAEIKADCLASITRLQTTPPPADACKYPDVVTVCVGTGVC